MLKYSTHAKNNSLYNTPPTFAIYLMALVLAEIKKTGGLQEVAKRNAAKAALIYDAIDNSNGFYKGHAEKESRSLMNITFRLANEEIEKKFLSESKTAGFVGLSGHRSVGGCRASAYNAVPLEACQALKDFMLDFAKKNA
jgi:phosphoserine aminotransferase